MRRRMWARGAGLGRTRGGPGDWKNGGWPRARDAAWPMARRVARRIGGGGEQDLYRLTMRQWAVVVSTLLATACGKASPLAQTDAPPPSASSTAAPVSSAAAATFQTRPLSSSPVAPLPTGRDPGAPCDVSKKPRALGPLSTRTRAACLAARGRWVDEWPKQTGDAFDDARPELSGASNSDAATSGIEVVRTYRRATPADLACSTGTAKVHATGPRNGAPVVAPASMRSAAAGPVRSTVSTEGWCSLTRASPSDATSQRRPRRAPRT